MRHFREAGYKPKEGFQLRYLLPIDPTVPDRLTVPILPFSAIAEAGAGMYRGERRVKQATTGVHPAGRQGGTDPRAPKSPAAEEGDEPHGGTEES